MSVAVPRERVAVPAFGPLLPGDMVTIDGERGTFRFRCAVHDVVAEGPVVWIDLYGGLPHREKLRSVVPERVRIPSARQLRRQRAARANDV